MAEVIIRPQAGFQNKFLSSSADIVIGGSAAGVGKTYALLMEYLRHKHVKDFGGVIFRRTSPQIRSEGGLWDTSMKLYPFAGGLPRESSLEWLFSGKSKLKFSHLEYEKNVLDWQGAQVPLIGFDELPHFTKKMFFYMLTRNRSVCGVRPYVRATCNPDPESWVAEFVSWWIDPETGYPIPERDGVLRYLIIDGDNYIWGDTPEEVIKKAWYILEEMVARGKVDPRSFVKSVAFISGSIYDNQELLKVNPEYLANLLSQDEATQMSLLRGNWKVIISDTDVYNYYSFLGCFDNVFEVDKTGKFITADIALMGSNKFVVGYWEGNELSDIEVLDKSAGDRVVGVIQNMAKAYKVQNKHIAFDADGVGGFVDGFIKGAIPFHGGNPPLVNESLPPGERQKENYQNLKTQCYYHSGKKVNDGEMRISERAANKRYDEKMSVKQRFIHERKAIKRDKVDSDGKLRIIKKEEMKTKLNGESPDLMDMFSMRSVFDYMKIFNQDLSKVFAGGF